MRVTIIGSTGRIGSHALTAALAAGHDVTVLNRRPAAAGGVREIVGDPGSALSVREAVAGADAVISALGPRSNRQADEDALERAMQVLVAAMTEHRVRRLVALSGAGVDVVGDHKPAIDRLVSRFVRVAARHVVAAKQREFAVLSGADLDWTALRPAIVTDGAARGYRLSLDLRPGARTTRADVGQALCDQLTDSTFVRQAPFVLPL